MWSTIALYDGRENNIIWHREGDSIVPYAAESIGAGDVFSLDADAIHSVHNPLSKYTAAIHVYGGDFMATPRSEWEPENLVERPRDMEAARRAFAEADQLG
jgi:predicted metal-dependent enzyme (double-stranded beta helix superfamily)